MSVFIVFIVTLGVMMMRTNDSLYETNYYEKGEHYTSTMNATAAGHDVEIRQDGHQMDIVLPRTGKIEKVVFRNMSDNQLDRILRGGDSTSEHFHYDYEKLPAGQWYVDVSGTMDKDTFLKQNRFFVQ